MRFVSEAEKQAERKVHGKIYEKSRNFLYAFSGLAAQICGIAQAAAGQTEYSAAFAAVAVVLKVGDGVRLSLSTYLMIRLTGLPYSYRDRRAYYW